MGGVGGGAILDSDQSYDSPSKVVFVCGGRGGALALLRSNQSHPWAPGPVPDPAPITPSSLSPPVAQPYPPDPSQGFTERQTQGWASGLFSREFRSNCFGIPSPANVGFGILCVIRSTIS